MDHLSQILTRDGVLHFILYFIKLFSVIILSVLHSHIAVTLKLLKNTPVISILHYQQLAALNLSQEHYLHYLNELKNETVKKKHFFFIKVNISNVKQKRSR